MKILLTGEIGVGKTNVCAKIVEKARKNNHACCGVLTWKYSDKLIVEDIATGARQTLAVMKNATQKGKCIPFCSYLFNESAVEFSEEALSRIGELQVIDEFGPLELEGRGFKNALKSFCSNQNQKSIMVVRAGLKKKVIRLLDCDFNLIEVNIENREKMPNLLFKQLFG